jgi:hypothetical protein
MGEKLLSIGIPSLEVRNKQLNRLLVELEKQIIENGFEDLVEIIVAVDNKEISKGEKFNMMMENATGKYVVGIGDDDIVAPTYIKEIMDVVKTEKYDHITFNMLYKDKTTTYPMTFSKKHTYLSFYFPFNIKIRIYKYYDVTNPEKKELYFKERLLIKNNFLIILFILIFKKFMRKQSCPTWPTMVIKKEIANKVKYTNIDREEDIEWAINIGKLNLIKEEYNINKDLYFYTKNFYYFDREKNIEIEHKIQPIDKNIIKFVKK